MGNSQPKISGILITIKVPYLDTIIIDNTYFITVIRAGLVCSAVHIAADTYSALSIQLFLITVNY